MSDLNHDFEYDADEDDEIASMFPLVVCKKCGLTFNIDLEKARAFPHPDFYEGSMYNNPYCSVLLNTKCENLIETISMEQALA